MRRVARLFRKGFFFGENFIGQVLGLWMLMAGAAALEVGMADLAEDALRAAENEKPSAAAPGSASLVAPGEKSSPASQEPAGSAQTKKEADDPHAWKDLFDGKTLKGWKAPQFGGEGKVEVKDGQIILHAGETMTGVVYEGKVPTTNYELELEAKRVNGSDFFATTTFPVGDSHVSFVTGGWGGTVIGISCVDWRDASDNPTSAFREFKNNQWYKFRIRVTDSSIQVWIDGDPVVDLPRKGYKFSVRAECDPCRPLGIASWCTTGAVRNIRIRQLKPEEVKEAAEEKK